MNLHIKDFDDDLHQAAKEVAVKRRQSLKDFVTDAVREKLERDEHERESR